MDLNPKEKIICICSHYISRRGMDKHLESKSHKARLISKKKDGVSIYRLNKYNELKDEYNCCHKCYRTKIPDPYFNKSTNTCEACDEIALDQDKLCRYCNNTKNISLFERPYLTKCKRCAADRSAIRVQCDICNKYYDKGSLAKHKKSIPYKLLYLKSLINVQATPS